MASATRGCLPVLRITSITKRKMEKLIEGVIEVCDIVSSTMGPFGKKVILQSRNPSILDVFSRDGVTVADNCQSMFNEAHKDIGSRLVVDAASRTVSRAADGTSSTCAMVGAGLKAWDDISTPGTIADLDRLRDRALKTIKDNSRVPLYEDFEKAVIAAANNLTDLGQTIAKLVWELGVDAFIRPENGLGKKTTARIDDGYRLPSGVLLPQFLKANGFKNVQNAGNRVVLFNPYVVIIEEDIEKQKALIPIYSAYKKASPNFERPLVIVAGNCHEAPLRFVLQNLFKGDERGNRIPCFVIGSPDKGHRRYHILEDVAAATNAAKVYSKYNGLSVSDFKDHNDFGSAKVIEISTTETRIVPHEVNGLAAQVLMVKELLSEAEKMAERGDVVFEPDFFRTRIAAMTNGTGVISVGGYTRTENNYQAQVIDDAVGAAKAILRDGGVVPGSGATYLRCRVDGGYDPLAVKVFNAMMEAPRRMICENASHTAIMDDQVLNLLTGTIQSDETTDVLDPRAVAEQVVINSISLVSELLQSKYIITHG